MEPLSHSDVIFLLSVIEKYGDGEANVISIQDDTLVFVYLSDSGMSSRDVKRKINITETLLGKPKGAYLSQAVELLSQSIDMH